MCAPPWWTIDANSGCFCLLYVSSWPWKTQNHNIQRMVSVCGRHSPKFACEVIDRPARAFFCFLGLLLVPHWVLPEPLVARWVLHPWITLRRIGRKTVRRTKGSTPNTRLISGRHLYYRHCCFGSCFGSPAECVALLHIVRRLHQHDKGTTKRASAVAVPPGDLNTITQSE